MVIRTIKKSGALIMDTQNNKLNKICAKQNCGHYIEWKFQRENNGSVIEYNCISCKLNGESVNIEKIADDCPRKLCVEQLYYTIMVF